MLEAVSGSSDRPRAIGIFVLNVLYCLLATAQEGLPGWHMFESVERLDVTMHDKDGVAVDLAAVLPRRARIVDRSELYEVARFACQRAPARAPFVLEERDRGRRLPLGSDCKVHAPR